MNLSRKIKRWLESSSPSKIFISGNVGFFGGWSMSTTQKVSASPDQTGTYAEVREMWKRYIKKLCKKNLSSD